MIEVIGLTAICTIGATVTLSVCLLKKMPNKEM